jgi:hypothetical protein
VECSALLIQRTNLSGYERYSCKTATSWLPTDCMSCNYPMRNKKPSYLFDDTNQKALFDSCHSGTILDLPYSRFFGPRSQSPPHREGHMIASPFRSDSPAPDSPITFEPSTPRPRSQSHPQSPTDVPPLKQMRRGPLGTTYHTANLWSRFSDVSEQNYPISL